MSLSEGHLEGSAPAKKFRLRSVCAVSSCRSPQEMSFHRLPRNPKLRELWMKACGRKTPVTANARICGLHFQPQDFVRDLRSELMGCRHIRRLQPYACPSLHLPEDVKSEMEDNTQSHLAYDISNIHNYAEMAGGIKTLQLTEEEEPQFTTSPQHNKSSLLTFPIKDESLPGDEKEDLECQLEETIIHITPEMDSSPFLVGVMNVPYVKSDITKTLVLKSISGEAFSLLCNRGMIHNPSHSHQYKWMKTFMSHQGVQIDALDILEERIQAYDASKDRLCILAVDEIPVRNGSIETVTVGFARGLFKNWKQAIYFNESKTDHEDIQILIRELEKRGLKVIALAFPPESLTSCVSGFGLDTNTYSFPNPYDPERAIYALPDSVRILKQIRKEILKREILICNKVLSIKDFNKVYHETDHLTPEHLNENESSLLLATQLISWSSSKALANVGKKKQSHFIKVLNDWFDVMNSSEEGPPLFGDRLSAQSKSLTNLLRLIPKIAFVKDTIKSPGHKSRKSIPIAVSLVISVQATKALYNLIQSWTKVKSFSTRRLSCEFIEDMVGPSFIRCPQHGSVFHRFRMLQFFGADDEVAPPRDADFIPTVQVFKALDVQMNIEPYLEKSTEFEDEMESLQEDG